MGGRHAANRGVPEEEPNDADAYDAWMRRHGEGLLTYVLGLTRGDRAEAQAIVKETWYRSSQSPTQTTRRGGSVRARLIVVARAVFDEGRGSRRAGGAGPIDHPGAAARGAPTGTMPGASTTVVRALGELSRQHRDILVELFYGGTSLEDAAAARAIPVETVKTRLYYAMRALRAVLDQQAPGPR